MPFLKGQSGNPGGRPKRDWTWSGLLEKVAEEIETKSGQKFKDLVTKRLWVDAINGSLGAQKEILNRMDGLPQVFTDITTGGEKIIINIDELIGLFKTTRKTTDGDKDAVPSSD